MPKRSHTPVPSGIIRALADQLRREGSVWEGRGRRPIDDARPALISVLQGRLGLSRSVIQRALHGRSRAAPVQGARSSAGSKTSRSESRSEIAKQGPQAGSDAYYRAITAAMAAAHRLPGSRAQRPAPEPAPAATLAPKSPDIKHLSVPVEVSPAAVPGPGGRGLEAIGLHPSRSERLPAPSVPGHVPAGHAGHRLSAAQDAWNQARLVLEDGIDLVLSQGTPDPELRRLLLEVQRHLEQLGTRH